MIDLRLFTLVRSGLGLTVVVAATTAAPVQAQLDGSKQAGSQIYSEPQEQNDPGTSSRYSKAVANCLYKRLGKEKISEYLKASDPVSTDLKQAGLRWTRVERALEDCMGAWAETYYPDVRMAKIGMSFSQNRLRALLMEEAYLDSQATPLKIAEGSGELTDRTYVSRGKNLATAQGLGNFADCVAYRDASGADAMLRTEPGSAEELAGAHSLGAVLGACLIQGQEIEFTAASIRAIAADGLWSRLNFGPKGTH